MTTVFLPALIWGYIIGTNSAFVKKKRIGLCFNDGINYMALKIFKWLHPYSNKFLISKVQDLGNFELSPMSL